MRLFSTRPNSYFDKKGNNDTFMFILTSNICFTKFDEILKKIKILLGCLYSVKKLIKMQHGAVVIFDPIIA